MTLMTVRLELARNEEFPEGSSSHGCEFNAPLSKDGHIDKAKWDENTDDCTVRRFWNSDEEDDEPIFRMETHSFTPGEYVSITEHDGKQRTFRVASVKPSPLSS